MHAPTKGTTRTPATRAKITQSIAFIERMHAEAIADAERNSEFLEGHCFYNGRAQGFELALFELQSLLEVAR